MSRTSRTSALLGRSVHCWVIAPAVFGRGSTLLGQVSGCTAVLAPPGVRLSNDLDRSEPLSHRGWRIAWWLPHDDGRTPVEDCRPFDTTGQDEPLELDAVVAFVAQHCAEHLSWLSDVVRDQIRWTAASLRPDYHGNLPDDAEEFERLLRDRLEAVKAVSDGRPYEEPLGGAWLSVLHDDVSRILDESVAAWVAG